MSFPRLAVIVISLLLASCGRPSQRLDLWAIQNTAHPTILISCPLDVRVVIAPDIASLDRLKMILEEQQAKSVDHLILMRGSSESFEAAWQLAQTVSVRNLYYPNSSEKNAAFPDYGPRLNDARIRVRTLNRHQYIPLKLAEIVVLNPVPVKNPHPLGGPPPLTMKLIFGKSSVLFTGEASLLEQEELLQVYRSGLKSSLIVLPVRQELSPAFRTFVQGMMVADPASGPGGVTHYVSNGSRFSPVTD